MDAALNAIHCLFGLVLFISLLLVVVAISFGLSILADRRMGEVQPSTKLPDGDSDSDSDVPTADGEPRVVGERQPILYVFYSSALGLPSPAETAASLWEGEAHS